MPARLARGVRVGDRYRLERRLGAPERADADDSGTGTWEAIDERLDRPVALRVFDPSLDRATIVQRAGRAASLTHPRVVRIFDTGEEGGRFFTVSELVTDPLSAVRLPLGPQTALETATDIAEALGYAHGRGVVHGNLHESNVLLSESGAKVGDFAMSPSADRAEAADDLRALGALIRRVSRPADLEVGTPFGRIVARLSAGDYGSAGEVFTDLRALRPPPPQRSGERRSRRGLVLIAAILLGLVAFGVMRLGDRQPGQELIPGGRIDGTPYRIVSADDLDPPPGDGTEGGGSVGNAIDGDAATFWSTERYRESADFNGSKPGVGLVLDLGEGRNVGKAQILWTAQGCSFELRFASDPSAPVGEWGEAASVESSPVSAALEFEASNARYWLLWITRLAPSGSSFQCGIKEADLFSP